MMIRGRKIAFCRQQKAFFQVVAPVGGKDHDAIHVGYMSQLLFGKLDISSQVFHILSGILYQKEACEFSLRRDGLKA